MPGVHELAMINATSECLIYQENRVSYQQVIWTQPAAEFIW